MTQDAIHVPVLKDEVLDLLVTDSDGQYIDGTLGLGGHSEAILNRTAPNGRLVAIDRDPAALEKAKERLEPFGSRVVFVHGNYADVVDIAESASIHDVQGIFLDLGVSSMQLDVPERGFSFMHDGPLDMRMDTTQGVTAEDLVNSLSEKELADIIYQYGEESAARRIASAIVREREEEPISTTSRLAEIVSRAKGGRHGKINPATKTFQALRMAVNEETEGLRRGLNGALDLLQPGGRLAVITFHSLEDREVKHCFRDHVAREESLPQGGVKTVGKTPFVRLINKKPIVPGDDECKRNPRARSAKLRVVERT